MRSALQFGVAAAALALLAGCGSSTKTTTGASAPAPSSSSAASSSGYATGRPVKAAGASAVVVSIKHGKLGTVLAAGPKHLTVYLFEGDRGSTSACTGACASAWPPVTTAAGVSAAAGAIAADLGTVARPDGTRQVTYRGHLLYYFARDKDAGDTYGEGVTAFGAAWYALAPSGNKIDNS